MSLVKTEVDILKKVRCRPEAQQQRAPPPR